MSIYTCSVCETEFDESKEGRLWEQLPDDGVCLVCESGKSFWQKTADASAGGRPGGDTVVVLDDGAVPEKTFDDFETYMADILIKGAQLAKLPLNHDQPVRTKTVIGSGVAHPLVIDAPIFITHMSYGALSKEAKVALAKGSAAVKTAMCSGEGGILPASFENAYKYIFEYVPNEYSVTEENLKKADAIEIKFGQSAKPGMGGHLPADKVTEEIAAIRGFSERTDIVSPAHFKDILNREDLKNKVAWLREASGGKPIGI